MEHGLRPPEESKGDALAVRELCEKLKVPCRIVSVPQGRVAAYAALHGSGIEAAARVFRHRIFSKERRRVNADWILTGHTRDDALETLLMRILRGSGPGGLALMPRTRGYLLRPILEMCRQDVLDYLEYRGLPYRVDATNADTVFFRNRVRLGLVPVLNELFPSWKTSLLALGETQALGAAFFSEEVRKRLPWEESCGEFCLRVKEEDFLALPPILREELIFEGLDMLVKSRGKGQDHPGTLFKPPRRKALRQIALKGAAMAAAYDLGPLRLERRDGYVYLRPVRRGPGSAGSAGVYRSPERGFSLLIKKSGFYILKGSVWGAGRGKDLHIRAAPDGEGKSCFYARFPLVFRNIQEGDRIFRGGHRRRLSDILKGQPWGNAAVKSRVITVQDVMGPAALVFVDRQGELRIIKRDRSGSGGEGGSFFELSLEGGL